MTNKEIINTARPIVELLGKVRHLVVADRYDVDDQIFKRTLCCENSLGRNIVFLSIEEGYDQDDIKREVLLQLADLF